MCLKRSFFHVVADLHELHCDVQTPRTRDETKRLSHFDGVRGVHHYSESVMLARILLYQI